MIAERFLRRIGGKNVFNNFFFMSDISCILGTIFWTSVCILYVCLNCQGDEIQEREENEQQKKWKLVRDYVLLRKCALYWQECTVKRLCQPESEFYYVNFQNLRDTIGQIQTMSRT